MNIETVLISVRPSVSRSDFRSSVHIRFDYFQDCTPTTEWRIFLVTGKVRWFACTREHVCRRRTITINDERVTILSDTEEKKNNKSNNNDVDVQQSSVSEVSHILCYNIVGRYLNKILMFALKTFLLLRERVRDYSPGVPWWIRSIDPFHYSSIRLHVIRQRVNAVIDRDGCV